MLKSKLFKIFSTVLIICIILASAIYIVLNTRKQQENGGIESPPPIPVISTDAKASTARIYFNASSDTASSPAYRVNSSVAPHRIELTMNNVLNIDIDSLAKELSSLPLVKDWYRTILLDDSTAAFTIEFTEGFSYATSEYNPEGYIDLTVKADGTADSPVHIIRSKSSKQDESLALLCESVSDFSPSIVKTRGGKFCVTIGTFSSYEEAADILNSLKNDSFYIEELKSNENPQ